MTEDYEVWAVIYGNYFPREIHSLWTTKNLADACADELGGMWTAEAWTVQSGEDE